MLPNSYAGWLILLLLLATSPALAETIKENQSDTIEFSRPPTSDVRFFFYAKNTDITGASVHLSESWYRHRFFDDQLPPGVNPSHAASVRGIMARSFFNTGRYEHDDGQISSAPLRRTYRLAIDHAQEIVYRLPTFWLAGQEEDAVDELEPARNDAMINGALISLGALGIFDNVVIHWILDLHRAVPGPHALAVEIGIVVISTAMLATGIWRERRARRN